MVLADGQGGGPARREGMAQAHGPGQAHQALHGVGDIEADIQMPHLVALPGVDPTPPDLDAALQHGRSSPAICAPRSLSRTASLQVLLTKKICDRIARPVDGSYTLCPHISA